MEDGITGFDVGEEGVSQTLALVGPLHQTSYVHHIQERRHLAEIEANKPQDVRTCQEILSSLPTLCEGNPLITGGFYLQKDQECHTENKLFSTHWHVLWACSRELVWFFLEAIGFSIWSCSTSALLQRKYTMYLVFKQTDWQTIINLGKLNNPLAYLFIYLSVGSKVQLKQIYRDQKKFNKITQILESCIWWEMFKNKHIPHPTQNNNNKRKRLLWCT